MSTLRIIPTPISLPVGYCIEAGLTGLQDFVNTIIGGSTFVVDISAANSFYNIGATVPGVDARDHPWLRVSASNPEQNGWYNFNMGYWLMAHPVKALDERSLWMPRLAVADVDAYDGGEAGAVTDISGPFWTIDTDMAVRFPLAAGTLPSGAVVNAGDTGGNEQITQTESQMPPHTHEIIHPFGRSPAGDIDLWQVNAPGLGNVTHITESTGGTGTPPVADPMTIIPPYRAGIWIKRTGRVYYRLGP